MSTGVLSTSILIAKSIFIPHKKYGLELGHFTFSNEVCLCNKKVHQYCWENLTTQNTPDKEDKGIFLLAICELVA